VLKTRLEQRFRKGAGPARAGPAFYFSTGFREHLNMRLSPMELLLTKHMGLWRILLLRRFWPLAPLTFASRDVEEIEAARTGIRFLAANFIKASNEAASGVLVLIFAARH
jgi:hypothetical protein